MKKLFAILLALSVLMSLGTVAFAEGEDEDPIAGETAATTYTDVSTVTITKTYTATNNGVSPEETFTFSEFTPGETVGENPSASYPTQLPTITSIHYDEGKATADGTGTGTATATITLPTYTAVGVYTYSFNEVTPTTKTAGVTYNSTTLYLVVTVIEQNGKVRVAAVHCEGSSDAGTYGTEPKTDKFANSYESGTLAVSKSVTGVFGDKSKYFKVTVEFTAAQGEVIKSTISYSGGSGDYAVSEETPESVSKETYSVDLYLKDGDTFNFTNIPEGVTWNVTEADYTADADGGYDAATYSSTQTAAMTAGGKATCTITNNKDGNIDTGITLDSIPYILLLVAAAAVVVVMFIRKRRTVEE